MSFFFFFAFIGIGPGILNNVLKKKNNNFFIFRPSAVSEENRLAISDNRAVFFYVLASRADRAELAENCKRINTYN